MKHRSAADLALFLALFLARDLDRDLDRTCARHPNGEPARRARQ
jgi:hypothetical protein